MCRALPWLPICVLAASCATTGSTDPVPTSEPPATTAGAGAAATPAPAPSEASAGAATAPTPYPAELVAGPSTGQPGLFLGPEPGAAAIGYVSEGTLLEIAGPAQGDRVPVRIRGGMRVRGWFPVARLAARATRRGRVDGTPLYVGANDLLRVLGPGPGGTLRVEGRVMLRPGGPEGPTFAGTLPLDALGTREVPITPDQQLPSAFYSLPAGAAVPIFDRPGGSVVTTIPALTPPLVVRLAAQRDGWNAVLVGEGPYIAGYMQGALTPASPPPAAQAPAASAGGVPRRLQEETQLALWRLPAGTRIRFDGVTIAALDREGYAREMMRHEATREVDVFVAVDDQVAVRGMIPADTLATAQRMP